MKNYTGGCRAWGTKNPGGRIVDVGWKRTPLERYLVGVYGGSWKSLYRQGWRIVRVVVREKEDKP